MQNPLPDPQVTGLELPDPQTITAAQRDRILWEATQQYIQGKITAEQLKAIEARYAPSKTFRK